MLTRNGISWVNYHNVRHYSVLARRVLGGQPAAAVGFAGPPAAAAPGQGPEVEAGPADPAPDDVDRGW